MHARRPTTSASSVRSRDWTRARGKASAVCCKAVAPATVNLGSPQQEVAPPQLSRAWLPGKHILILGMSASGTAASQLAAVHGATVLGLDERMTEDELNSRTREEIPAPLFGKIKTTRRVPNYDELECFDLLIVSPGFPLKHRLPTQAIARNIPVTSELAFAAAMLPESVQIVCVTGTNGKSTTTSFLSQMLTAMGHRVWCGGNFGTPLSSLAYETAAGGGLSPHIAAVEVSSYQLEPEGQFSVTAGCILNVSEDHLDRHQSMDNYTKTKAKLIDHMKPGYLGGIVCQEVFDRCGYKSSVQSCARIGSMPGVMLRRTEAYLMHWHWRTTRLLDLSALQDPGQHNMINAAVAAFLATAVSPGEQEWKELQACIPHLVGLPHRIELAHKDVHGVKWINDSKSTNLGSVQAALETIQGQAVVMLGGAAKRNEQDRLGFDALAPLLKQHKVIAFGASANEIKFELQESGVSMSGVCDTLKEAVEAARKAKASAGLNTVLLSPGCASFDEFKDFADRGHKFTAYATGRL